MIVPMQKLTLLCLEREREPTLDTLRDLGVVHLVPVRHPDSEDLDAARQRLEYVRRALGVLPKHADGLPTDADADRIVEDIWTVLHERKTLDERAEALRYECQRVRPFGSFDPKALGHLAEAGIHAKLYRCRPKSRVDIPEGVTLETLSADKNGKYVAAFSRQPFDLDADEFRLPEKSLAAMEAELSEIDSRSVELDEALKAHAADYEKISSLVDGAEERVRYLEARESMGEQASIAYLEGFCPADAADRVSKAAAAHGWGLMLDEPDNPDEVPTLIRNPKWVQPIKPIFDFIGILPGYREVDISSLFLLFFSLFFAMIVGDAGYGAIFLGLTLLLRKKIIAAQPLVFTLLFVMSLGTILWGVVTGNYFGVPSSVAPFPALRIAWLGNEDHIMALCFLIGAVHLTLAHGWNVVRYMGSGKALEQVGWICTTWVMYFMARNMILGAAIPSFVMKLFIVGAALIFLFMSPLKNIKKDWANYVVFPLDIVSNFVDLVSYIRLFAVGMATYAVASAFNEMAMGIGFGSVASGLVTSLIIFFGHTLNMALAGMGVLVHGIRLNALEFSTHLGLEWSGRRYDPFAKKKQTST